MSKAKARHFCPFWGLAPKICLRRNPHFHQRNAARPCLAPALTHTPTPNHVTRMWMWSKPCMPRYTERGLPWFASPCAPTHPVRQLVPCQCATRKAQGPKARDSTGMRHNCRGCTRTRRWTLSFSLRSRWANPGDRTDTETKVPIMAVLRGGPPPPGGGGGGGSSQKSADYGKGDPPSWGCTFLGLWVSGRLVPATH